ncbi:MAG: hypothetical protein KGJ09_07960 [Candidatus Omnitrophica bacterium]|nr:hypothetical protein [Candidatus Omnitrophota bacterium]MDE2009995.1 hypothetical protein [Candidatus Omnitrophota bacterium]MDE2215321.1 hypothetical protein [Candidatus Omnitrophota bacterium]MDE2231727.1 hypothetical protein [Candidatus Omnitrophota bacterium]
MAENFIIKALFISLAAHTVLLCTAYLSRIHERNNKVFRSHLVEVTYKPTVPRTVDVREYPIRVPQRLDLSHHKLFSKGSVPVSLGQENSQLPFEMFSEHKPEGFDAMELSHRVFIRPIMSAKINNPVYAVYNEMVRERIKERVYANYDKLEAGEVYLTFLLDKNGVLKEARIVPEKTNASLHLQELSLKSLQEASPFAHFLKGMNLQEYSFNIEIQYQVSD